MQRHQQCLARSEIMRSGPTSWAFYPVRIWNHGTPCWSCWCSMSRFWLNALVALRKRRFVHVHKLVFWVNACFILVKLHKISCITVDFIYCYCFFRVWSSRTSSCVFCYNTTWPPRSMTISKSHLPDLFQVFSKQITMSNLVEMLWIVYFFYLDLFLFQLFPALAFRGST